MGAPRPPSARPLAEVPARRRSLLGQALDGGGLAVCDLRGKPLISQGNNGSIRMICHQQATGGRGKVTMDYDALDAFVTDRVFNALESDETRALLAETTDDDEQSSLNERLGRWPKKVGAP